MQNITLAYSITIHKSQGSEFKSVIIPMMWNKKKRWVMAIKNLINCGVMMMNMVMRICFCVALTMSMGLATCADDEVKLYNNPVAKWSLPDPSVIKAADNYFYLYATEDTHNVPIYRSKDLVTWRYAGTAFTDATRPMDFVPKGGIWAPDINYIDGQYVLYYSKSWRFPTGPMAVSTTLTRCLSRVRWA